MTQHNVRIQNTLAAIEAAFVDVKTRIDTSGKAALNVIMKSHRLPMGISQSMQRLGVVEKDSDSGGAVRYKYEYLTNATARKIYDDYLAASRTKQKSRKKPSKPSSKQSDPILSLTPNEVIEKPKKSIQRPAESIAKLASAFEKIDGELKPTATSFELRLFGFSLYKVIRNGLQRGLWRVQVHKVY